MNGRIARFSPWIVAVILLTSQGRMCAAGDAAESAAKATADEATPRELQKIYSDFAKARTNFPRRQALAERGIAAGGEAPARLLDLLNRELAPQINAYRESLSKFAAGKDKARGKQVDPVKIAELRARVLALKDDPNLTKEQIQQVADPAIEELARLILPDMQALSVGNKGLMKQRARLLKYAMLWEKLSSAVLLQHATEEEVPPAPPSFEAALRAEEEQALYLAASLDEQTRKALSINAQLSGKLDPEEARCIAACNLMRCLLGLPALIIDPALVQTARDHSQDMEKLGFFAHESPVPGKTTPWDRAKKFGTTASAENIAKGMSQGISAHMGWFHSPPHHRNMVGQHVRIGVGKSGVLWTQVFGR